MLGGGSIGCNWFGNKFGGGGGGALIEFKSKPLFKLRFEPE